MANMNRILRLLKRAYSLWRRGRQVPVPWWADRLTIVWTWRQVPLSDIGKFVTPLGVRKRGFVVRRDGTYLTGPVFHDLWWLRRFLKQRAQVWGVSVWHVPVSLSGSVP